MSLHIHWPPPAQPATRYWIDNGLIEPPRKHWIRHRPHQRAWCYTCGQRRCLKNMRVIAQAWYDPMFLCRQCPPRKRR
jgi:hypothetical protein